MKAEGSPSIPSAMNVQGTANRASGQNSCAAMCSLKQLYSNMVSESCKDTEGNVVHYGFIEKFIELLGERFDIREIAFDQWGAVQTEQNLENMGFKDMNLPSKKLMKLAFEKRFTHSGHPVLRWMMHNIYIRTDHARNIKEDKEKSPEKIDGAIAAIMALDRAIRIECATESVYEPRGILFIDANKNGIYINAVI